MRYDYPDFIRIKNMLDPVVSYWNVRILLLAENSWIHYSGNFSSRYFWRQYMSLFTSISAIVSSLFSSDRKSSRCGVKKINLLYVWNVETIQWKRRVNFLRKKHNKIFVNLKKSIWRQTSETDFLKIQIFIFFRLN